MFYRSFFINRRAFKFSHHGRSSRLAGLWGDGGSLEVGRYDNAFESYVPWDVQRSRRFSIGVAPPIRPYTSELNLHNIPDSDLRSFDETSTTRTCRGALSVGGTAASGEDRELAFG